MLSEKQKAQPAREESPCFSWGRSQVRTQPPRSDLRPHPPGLRPRPCPGPRRRQQHRRHLRPDPGGPGRPPHRGRRRLPRQRRHPPRHRPLDLDEIADQLVAAAVAEGLDTFALQGYSLGGPVAIRAAARHPERVTALVLTATMAHPNNQQALTLRVWGKLAATGDRHLVSEFLFPHALSPQAMEAMPAEQLEEVITYAAADIADGTVEQADHADHADRVRSCELLAEERQRR
ncbi:alpha/beta fold hydrolase [Streptomyces mirabilis]|uniref:alpha/beta fold hydrolase n=1 Tax=Streptomyces mirabilis TaxID=68239 RepID=UPI002F9170D7